MSLSSLKGRWSLGFAHIRVLLMLSCIFRRKELYFLLETIQVAYAGIGFFAADIVMATILVCGACQVIMRFSHLLNLALWQFNSVIQQPKPPYFLSLKDERARMSYSRVADGLNCKLLGFFYLLFFCGIGWEFIGEIATLLLAVRHQIFQVLTWSQIHILLTNTRCFFLVGRHHQRLLTENASKWPQTPWNNKEYDRKAKLVSFIHRTLDFRYLKQTRKVPIQTLVNRIFVTQHRSKARVTLVQSLNGNLPELSFLPTPFKGWAWAGEKRV